MQRRGKLGSFSFEMRAGRCCLQLLMGGRREDGAELLLDMQNKRGRKSQHGKLSPVRLRLPGDVDEFHPWRCSRLNWMGLK